MNVSRLRSRRCLVALVALAAASLTNGVGTATAAEETAAPAQIAVRAALGGCDVTARSLACEIEVSFDPVPGARSYEVVISAPDGAVLVSAATEPGSSAYSVPYRGDGTYHVQIAAFGGPVSR